MKAGAHVSSFPGIVAYFGVHILLAKFDSRAALFVNYDISTVDIVTYLVVDRTIFIFFLWPRGSVETLAYHTVF